MIDYSDTYDRYWQRSDRMGESSFDDPAPIVAEILSASGSGKILDVGCGMGALVREMLRSGADAYGIDVSPVAIAACHQFASDRFLSGSVLALPFPNDSFDTIVSTDCLEHLAPEHVGRALQEMRRVCRRNLFLYVATERDRDGHWHLTVEKRSWWEKAAFLAGFRKHPNYYFFTPFEALETDGNCIAIPLEKIRDELLMQYPYASLLQRRDLHMDMSRESGRRSDAHMARYQLAADYVRDGDTVLDAACGMGYGSSMLARISTAAKVIGVDLDGDAIEYANVSFNRQDGRLSFHTDDVQQLNIIPDNSVDLFVCFETLEHVPGPECLLDQAIRVLRPGGRIIVSVPNRWVNEDGIDPNPYHLHVYDWGRLACEMRSRLLLEAAYGQTAGGGMILASHPRALFEFDPDGPPPEESEWFIAVGMKDPVGRRDVPYTETALHWAGEPPNIAAFARDYDNPWLVRGLISIGWCNRNRRQRTEMAQRTQLCSPFSSPDMGAAICVLSYALLESPLNLTPSRVREQVAQIDAFIKQDFTNPQCKRWSISLLYVRGLLWQSIGEVEMAIESFGRCADSDTLAYSPLLATKTVDACRIAGKLAYFSGNIAEAQQFWIKGIKIAEVALRGEWREIYGDVEHPFFFGLREATQVLDIAGRCSEGIRHLNIRSPDSGMADGWSFAVRLQDSCKVLEQTARELAELKASPYVRLQNAVQHDPHSVRRTVRISYLLALILLPPKLKRLLGPLARQLRHAFFNRYRAKP